MENFAPGLRESILGVSASLRVVVFFICVVGLMIQVNQARHDVEGIMRPIIRGIVVVALLATLPHWFEFTEKIFLGIANTVKAGYTEHPMQVAEKLRASVAEGGGDFSLRRIGEAIYQAFLHGAIKLIVLVASILQFPLLLLQFALKLLCFLFLPIALGLFMIPSQSQWATRYLQQTVAVLAWPIGFAVTELIAYHLLTAYGQNLATMFGLQSGEISAVSFGSRLGGLLAAVWVIIGTLGTPFLMQGLIVSGTPMSTGGQSSMQQLYALHSIISMVKAIKTGGAAVPLVAAQAASRGGGNQPPPPPRSSPPPPSPTGPAPKAPDVSGDHGAAAAIAMSTLPTAKTGI